MYPMENDLKKCIEEHTEKLAAMVAEGFASTATKQEVSDLRTQMNERFDKVEASLDKKYQEIDVLRDRMRLLETRVDNLEAVHR
jgi:predicted nuclease with TOPRIM domain